MMTSVVSSFFPNKHVREGGETVKARLSGAWNLPVQVPAAPLPGAPAWSKDLSHFDNKNLFRKESTEKALGPVL